MTARIVDVEALRGHTPGPWEYVSGGGHAFNSIAGSDVVQVRGWLHDRGDVSNRSYSDRVCENLGDIELPFPAANARLIAAAPDLLAEVIERRARDEQVAEVLKESEAFIAGFEDVDCEETLATVNSILAKLRAALSAIRGGATG